MVNSGFTEIKKERMYEKIVRQVVELIKEGELKPGDRLPAERQLAITLGCSRTSLREACRVLESEGLIISKPGGGRFIQHIDQHLAPNYEFDTVNLIKKTAILHFLEVREVLEPKIVELACERATKEDLEKMEAILQQMEESLKYPNMLINEDHNFHLTLAEATQNFVFVSLMKSNLNMINQTRKQILGSHKRYEEALREHQLIFEMIKEGNSSGAVHAITDHLQTLRAELLKETS
ncbi:FadR/GntR family transcriptional regulator [Ornithinibacillus sp. 4-3]|uniref:FadR/GntR family transcriptional regulator n=1 Tax=Ornithinibacillus sp. 4-3 TaxID=3231488 RepID=A0AB39HU10_9BACI